MAFLPENVKKLLAEMEVGRLEMFLTALQSILDRANNDDEHKLNGTNSA